MKLFIEFYFKDFHILELQGKLVPKLTLGPFLSLSVINGHKLKDFWDSGPYSEQKSIVKTVTNILLSMTRTTIPNLKLLSEL